jgi:nickel transport protein
MKGGKQSNRLLIFFKISLNLIFVFLLIHIAGSKVSAHKVNIFAYIEGDTVFTESYFNDGRKCIDSKIEVFDNTGDKLLEGLTNKDGEFSFKSPGKIDLRLVLTAGMGHKAQYEIKADEFSDSEEEDKEHTSLQPLKEDIIDKRQKEEKQTGHTETLTVDMKQMQSMIEASLDKKLRPLLKLIAKSQQNRVSFSEVVGGIGYILGIMGIILYFKAKKDKNG